MKSMNLFGDNNKTLLPAPIQDENGNLTFSLEGKTYSLNVNSEEEREKVKREVNINSLAKYNWFKEESGKRHWVLYNTEMYEVLRIDSIECLRYKEYSGLTPIIPINATSCHSMFYDCPSLTSLDLGNFDTSKVIDMSQMFLNCLSLISLDLSNFDTSKVTTMHMMVEGCKSLKSLDLSNFNTSRVIYMREMFAICNELTSLDLSSFDTSKVTTMYCMFYGCKKLTSIYIYDKWKTNKVTEDVAMFDRCCSLPNFNKEKTDAEMAKPVEQGGYLTLKR